MPSRSRKITQVAIPVVILLIAVVRFTSDGSTGDPWVTILGVLVGLTVVVLLFVFAVVLTRRRRLRATPLLDGVRRDGGTAYLCSRPMDPELMIVAVDKTRDLTIYRVHGSKLEERTHLDRDSYSVREAPVPLDLASTIPGLVIEQFGSELISLHVHPDDAHEIGHRVEQQEQAREARMALIKASR